MNTKIAHGIHKKDLLLKYLEQKKKAQQIQDNALDEAKRLAKILVEEFGVEKVFLVGPLTYGEFREGMTLELALEGIREGTYAKALAYLKHNSTFSVELIDFQQADSWTKRSIAEKGKVLAKIGID